MTEAWPLRRCDKGRWEYADTKGNAGYREAEYQIWVYRKKGGTDPHVERLIWRLHSHTLHKMNIALGKVSDDMHRSLARASL